MTTQDDVHRSVNHHCDAAGDAIDALAECGADTTTGHGKLGCLFLH
jgi:hypothetical protein